MNLLLFEAGELAGEGILRLREDRRHQHLQKVLNSRIGDTLRVGEIGGLCGVARVIHIDGSEARLSVRLSEPPPPALDTILVLALPRPKMLRRILRASAELGVKELHLIHSYRVEKSFWQSPLLQTSVLRDYLLSGLEQVGDTIVPSVSLHRRFRPFVEDRLPALGNGRDALLAHPGAGENFPSHPHTPGLLTIGPEGGFIPFEEELLRVAGCRPVSLGQRILRVETAVQSALGRYTPGH